MFGCRPSEHWRMIVKVKDILIVVASAVLCVVVLIVLAVIWPMSSTSAGGEAIREQAATSEIALNEANRLLLQPAAKAVIEGSEQLFPFRPAAKSVIKKLGTNKITLMHHEVNPRVISLLDGGIGPLDAVLTKHPDAPRCRSGRGLSGAGRTAGSQERRLHVQCRDVPLGD